MESGLAVVFSILQQLLIWGHLLLVIGFSVRVVMLRLPSGVSLAWLLVLVLLPYIGVGLYLLFGERFLGMKRKQRSARLNKIYRAVPAQDTAENLDWSACHPASEALSRLELNTSGIPVLGGNRLAFLQTASATINAICEDIARAQRHCHMEFYIWHPGGLADRVADELLAAAERGVYCRIMLDAVGSSEFFASPLYRRLRHVNIELIKACPIGLMPWQLARYDLRNHRKAVVVDDRVTYLGSFNLIDPAFFKQDAGVGEWIDLMARIEGPAVSVVDAVFRWYWNIETDQELALLDDKVAVDPSQALVQVAPSGPDVATESILGAMLQALYAAEHSVDIVTPYFVPGEALEQALKIAARRGVRVRLIVPCRVDSFLVRHASRSYFSGLMEAGVEIYQYERGLLHSKCVLVDDSLAFFGTVNLDLRSLWLNFEMTLIIYDPATVQQLATIVTVYGADAHRVQMDEWQTRSWISRLFENVTHLFSPLI